MADTTDTDTRSHDESSGEPTDSDDAELPEHEECHETVDPETREDVLVSTSTAVSPVGATGRRKVG